MKKLLVVLGVVSLGVIGFAGAKEDYEMAESLAKQNKTTEAISTLQKVMNSGDTLYVGKAAYQLGVYYANTGNIVEAKKYLQIVSNNKSLTTEDKADALDILFKIALSEKNQNEAKKYIESLNTLTNGENVNVLSTLLQFYNEINLTKEFTAKYDEVMKSKKSNDFKAELNYNLGNYNLSKNKVEEAKKYLEKSYNLSTNGTIAAGSLLAQIEANNNNMAGAEKILLDVNTKTGNKDLEVLDLLGNFYLQVNNLNKAEEYYTRIANADSQNTDAKIILLGIYDEKNDTVKLNSLYNQLKAYVPAGQLNKNLGIAFAEFGNGKLSEKYLKKAINEDKDNEPMMFLAELYTLSGNRTEAINILNQAVKLNVQGASEMLKEVQNMK